MADPESGGLTAPTLVMTGGPLDGTTYPLSLAAKELTLGSSMEADVQIMLGNVEPFHASLAMGPAGLSIADDGSATGTFVNGERVTGTQILQEGDRICLGPPGAKGSAKLLVRLPGGAVPATVEDHAAESGASVEASPFGDEAAPLVIDDSEGPPLVLQDAPESDGAPSAAFGSEDAELTGEKILTAEEVIADDGQAGPPLEASEVPAETEAPQFDSPFPPPPPPPPPPSPSSAPPPEARYTDDSTPLTAPPPLEEQPPERPAPETPPEPRPLPTPPPPRRAPSRVGTARGRRPSPRRRPQRSSLPILPVAGGLIGILAVAAAGWWFLLRPSAPQPPAPSPPPSAAPTSAPAGTPSVSAVEPEAALPGQSVVIRGQSLSPPVSVTFGGAPAKIVETTPEMIRVTLPDLALPPGQKTELVVQAGGKAMAPMEFFLGQLPLVLEIAPSRGPVGEPVVIKGRGFDPEADDDSVTFGGVPGLVLRATSNELTVTAPHIPVSESPEVPVVVTAGGRSSAPSARFLLVRASGSAFLPRFFAAPVTEYPGESLAFVSTQLAPVLLLGGPGQSASTATRAAEVSAALNRLMDAASKGPLEIASRSRPSPAVVVAGQAEPLLVATREDAAAYSRAWPPGSRRQGRVQVQAVAEHWAAILQDYIGLFGHRERPLQMLARSPRGQVFMNIYKAARRRGGGRGVPTSIVYPTTPKMADDLKRAALLLADGAPRPAVAVEGTWKGDIQDPDRGERRFAVEFRLDGRDVSGSMTTWRGNIELSSPLREIRFSRGTLSFTVDLQGTPHRFEGALQGEKITGAAERQGLPSAPFTLEYAE